MRNKLHLLAMLETPRVEKAKELEHELIVMVSLFTEYVKAEDAWRDEFDKEKSDDLRIKASKLRMQAMEVLGL